MTIRIVLTCLIAVAFTGVTQGADLIVPSLPFRPAGPDKVLAGFMQSMLKDKSLSTKQRAEVLAQISKAEKLGDPDIAITQSLMSISPDFKASKRVLPVVGVYLTFELSPKTADATAWQTAGSKPTQLPASSVKAKPATPVETPH